MASSSSSLLPNHSFRHEVFPSFSGKDIRKTLLSHLLKEFQRKGIETFNDNGMIKRGQSIAPELIRAISESNALLVVLSKNYGSSSWCLNELVEILKMREIKGKYVMTLFYGVDPSDVRKQTGKFGRNFEKICLGKTEEEISIWRRALIDVANIAGENSEKWDNEADMIEKIVKDISNILNITPSLDFNNLVGISTHVAKLTSLLSLKSVNEVKMVGIWGASGIGKTTIARALFNQISNTFQLSLFMDNIKETNTINNYSLKLQFQEQFLSKIIDHQGIKTQNLSAIQERLKNKKVLIILDDITEIEQLVTLVNQSHWFGLGSRILVITEDKQVLKSHGINLVYKVDYPSCDQANEMLSRYVFGQSFPPENVKELVTETAKLVGNLPLGLSVLGSSLRGKSEEEWRIALPRVRSSLDVKLEKVLEVGYDCLDEKDKTIFLHIACFFNGEKVGRILQLLASSDLDIVFGLKVLVDKCLIHISSDERAVMHSLLQKLGREIVRKQSVYEPGKRQFLVNDDEICDVLRDATGTRSVLGISLDISKAKKLCIRKKALKKMRNLRFMRFYMSCMEEKYGIKVGKGVDDLPQKLRLLHWDAFPWSSIPSKFCCEYLVELNMQHSNLEKLWDGPQSLRNLKQMDLSFSKKLGSIPNLSKATNLETLDLSYCESLVTLSSSIGELNKLKDLTMFGCIKLQHLPTNLDLDSLESLYMDGCSQLKNFPEISTNIKLLYLGETSIEEVPSSITSWSRLLEFNMSGNKKLKTFPQIPDNVRLLSLSNNEFENIPTGFIKKTSQLRSLDLTDCRKLVSLPELPETVTYINVDNCESLEAISHLGLNNRNIVLELGNCLKLDQETRNLVEKSEFEYVFSPGGEVSSDFTYCNTQGRFLNIQRSDFVCGISGFKACIVLSSGCNEDVLLINGMTGISCRVKGGLYNGSSRFKCYEWPVMYPSVLKSDHCCVVTVKGDHVVVEKEMLFEFGCSHHKIVACGVRLLTRCEEEGKFNDGRGVGCCEVFEERSGEKKRKSWFFTMKDIKGFYMLQFLEICMFIAYEKLKMHLTIYIIKIIY